MNGILPRPRGFTLVELLVSLALGLVIALAATQMLVISQSSLNLIRGATDAQDNGKFVLDFIRTGLNKVGYSVATQAVQSAWPAGIVTQTTDIPGGTAATISANDGTALGIGNSDQLVVKYYSDIETRDCEGNVVPAKSFVVQRFFLRADSTANTPSALACDGGYFNPQASAPAMVNYGDNGVVLLSSVDSFQIQFGVVTAAGAYQFLRVDQYAALAAPQPTIAAVRVGMLLRSADPVGGLPGTPPGYTVLDKVISSSAVPTDGRLRRLFIGTDTMRNALPVQATP